MKSETRIQNEANGPVVSKSFLRVWVALLVMVLGLMALGAGVRTMNAGLACPDWPLCFGKVIPDFHVGVYFEFIHRSYAGLVALVFFGCMISLWRNPRVSSTVKRLGNLALVVLITQIVMGGLTVLKLLKSGIVTSHLALATVFFAILAWMWFLLAASVDDRATMASARGPSGLALVALILPVVVFGQILLGGFVASTYAGSVCVDFPLCNGQWVPTWKGPIGLQVMHRFGAYFVALVILAFGAYGHLKRKETWMSSHFRNLHLALIILVFVQIGVGAANVLYFIPAWITVLHQSVAMLILATSLRYVYVARKIDKSISVTRGARVEYRAGSPATPSETLRA